MVFGVADLERCRKMFKERNSIGFTTREMRMLEKAFSQPRKMGKNTLSKELKCFHQLIYRGKCSPRQ